MRHAGATSIPRLWGILALLGTLACATPGVQDGATIGAGVGAVAGGAIASSDRGSGAALGLLAGAAAGAILGRWLGDPESRGPDSDGDGVSDLQDNCPVRPNRYQQDSDGNGIGDACEGQPSP